MPTENEKITERADISTYPTIIDQDPSRSITLGDMHGNTMKLIWSLIRHGVITMDKEDFTKMWKIYDKSGTGEFGKSDLEEFYALLGKVKVNPGYGVRLLGDVLADRGNNDWLTLKVLEKLQKRGCTTEIIASNHDTAFLLDYEETKNKETSTLALVDSKSLVGLRRLVDKGLIKIDEVKNLVEQHYLPHFMPISYSLSEDKQNITLYTHAHIPDTYVCEVIKAFAGELQVAYEAETADKLATTIDKINAAFQILRFANPEKFQQMMQKTHKDVTLGEGNEEVSTAVQDQSLDNKTSPLAKLVWSMGKNLQPESTNKLPLFVTAIVHGHIGGEEKQSSEKAINLDTDLGKLDTRNLDKVDPHNTGTHKVYRVRENLAENLKKINGVKDLLLPDCLMSKVNSWKTDSSRGFIYTRPAGFKEIDRIVDNLKKAFASSDKGKIIAWASLLQQEINLYQKTDEYKGLHPKRKLALDRLKNLTDTMLNAEKPDVKFDAICANWKEISAVPRSFRPESFKNIDGLVDTVSPSEPGETQKSEALKTLTPENMRKLHAPTFDARVASIFGQNPESSRQAALVTLEVALVEAHTATTKDGKDKSKAMFWFERDGQTEFTFAKRSSLVQRLTSALQLPILEGKSDAIRELIANLSHAIKSGTFQELLDATNKLAMELEMTPWNTTEATKLTTKEVLSKIEEINKRLSDLERCAEFCENWKSKTSKFPFGFGRPKCFVEHISTTSEKESTLVLENSSIDTLVAKMWKELNDGDIKNASQTATNLIQKINYINTASDIGRNRKAEQKISANEIKAIAELMEICTTINPGAEKLIASTTSTVSLSFGPPTTPPGVTTSQHVAAKLQGHSPTTQERVLKKLTAFKNNVDQYPSSIKPNLDTFMVILETKQEKLDTTSISFGSPAFQINQIAKYLNIPILEKPITAGALYDKIDEIITMLDALVKICNPTFSPHNETIAQYITLGDMQSAVRQAKTLLQTLSTTTKETDLSQLKELLVQASSSSKAQQPPKVSQPIPITRELQQQHPLATASPTQKAAATAPSGPEINSQLSSSPSSTSSL